MTYITCIIDKCSGYENHIMNSCQDHGVRVSFRDLDNNNRIIIKADQIFQEEKMCDCFIFIKDGESYLALVELKSKRIKVDDISNKFENAAIRASNIIKDCISSNCNIRFYPIIIHKGSKSTSEIRMIKKNVKIRFMDSEYKLIFTENGTSLKELFLKYP